MWRDTPQLPVGVFSNSAAQQIEVWSDPAYWDSGRRTKGMKN